MFDVSVFICFPFHFALGRSCYTSGVLLYSAAYVQRVLLIETVGIKGDDGYFLLTNCNGSNDMNVHFTWSMGFVLYLRVQRDSEPMAFYPHM